MAVFPGLLVTVIVLPTDREDKQRSRMVRKRGGRLRRRRRRLKAVAVVPSMFTLGNLLCGFAAVYYAAKPFAAEDQSKSLLIAGILVFVGMFFDSVDGYVARLTRSVSELGGQLDSLADIVTFGVAPAYMTLQLVTRYYLGGDAEQTVISPLHDDVFGRIFWVCAAIYVACTALRLARFNVETASGVLDDHMYFRGLPAPGAGGCVAGLILLHEHYYEALNQFQWVARTTGLGMTFILLLCAVAMVSRLPYVHIVNKYLRRKASFGFLVEVAIVLVCAAIFMVEAIALSFTAYALSAPLRSVWVGWRRRARAIRSRSA